MHDSPDHYYYIPLHVVEAVIRHTGTVQAIHVHEQPQYL